MIKELIAKIQDDDNPRLHRVPFTLMWIGSYAFGWCVLIMTMLLLDNINIDTAFSNISPWLNGNFDWIYGVATGLIFGLILSLIQTWLLRRRYGFVPRFWRYATIFGALIAGLALPILSDSFYRGNSDTWIDLIIWFMSFNLLQMLVLLPVNRRAWLIAMIGIVAATLAAAIEFWDVASYNTFLLAIIIGTLIQAVGTSIAVLYLMSHPREGVIPKRDTSTKGKNRVLQGLHPITFVGFWFSSYFVGAAFAFIIAFVYFATVGQLDMMLDFYNWLGDVDAEWLILIIPSALMGFIIALTQKWLMKQQGFSDMSHWLLLTTIGAGIAGSCFSQIVFTGNIEGWQGILVLLAWFAVPSLLQTIPMWSVMRGGWLWAIGGLVTTLIAFFIQSNVEYSYRVGFYLFSFGGVVYMLITATIFLLLNAQQQKRLSTETAEI